MTSKTRPARSLPQPVHTIEPQATQQDHTIVAQPNTKASKSRKKAGNTSGQPDLSSNNVQSDPQADPGATEAIETAPVSIRDKLRRRGPEGKVLPAPEPKARKTQTSRPPKGKGTSKTKAPPKKKAASSAKATRKPTVRKQTLQEKPLPSIEPVALPELDQKPVDESTIYHHILQSQSFEEIPEASFRYSPDEINPNSRAAIIQAFKPARSVSPILPLKAFGYTFENSGESKESDAMYSAGTATPDMSINSGGIVGKEKKVPTTISVNNQANFDLALKARSIDTIPRKHPAVETLRKRLCNTDKYVTTENEEKNWEKDLGKSMTALEAVFQHTIMIESIDRHNLDEVLDYTCETPWGSPDLPVRPGPRTDGITAGTPVIPLSNPKPDLAVAFKRELIVDPEELMDIKNLVIHMSPEGEDVTGQERAFPFLVVEVKGGNATIKGGTAARQSFNSATRALFNMWKFFEGNKETEKEFFESVKVFSATGHGIWFRIRMHWATEIKNRTPEDGDNRLFFVCQDVVTWQGSQYTKRNVAGTVRNILEFGVQTLLPLLKDAVKVKLEAARPVQDSASQTPALHPSQVLEKKRNSNSRDEQASAGSQSNKRQAVDVAASFSSQPSSTGASGVLGGTHLHESDQSFGKAVA